MNIQDITRQIKRNCDISDAQNWGYYSICGLLMRMRELYQHEHALMPWSPVSSNNVSDWISERENLWHELEDKSLEEIVIEGKNYNPFDSADLNKLLEPFGYVYGGGFGTFNKPQFFLGRLQEKREIYDYMVHSVGTELCRDLSLDPALLQGRCIYVRQDAIVTIFWDRFQTMTSGRCESLIEEVFRRYGVTKNAVLSEEFILGIDRITHAAADLFVHHEIGEAFEDELSEEWFGIITSVCDKFCELYLRGMKDIMADTSGMGSLRRIVQEEDENLLFLYVAMLDGIRKDLFPDIRKAFGEYRHTKKWQVIEEARQCGYKRAAEMKYAVIAYWREGGTPGGLQVLIRDRVGNR